MDSRRQLPSPSELSRRLAKIIATCDDNDAIRDYGQQLRQAAREIGEGLRRDELGGDMRDWVSLLLDFLDEAGEFIEDVALADDPAAGRA
jgi:hypothetical protein